MSSEYGLNINSIRLMETSLNLEKAISAITVLDVLISPGSEQPSSYKHGKVLTSLFDYILHDKLDKKLNEYIYNTFNLFAKNKQKIYIDFPKLDAYNKNEDGNLVNLLVDKIHAFDGNKEHGMNMDNINILRPEFFYVFPNINFVSITAWDMFEDGHYVFSLSELLSLIQDTKLNTVRIESSEWMETLWESSSGIFIEMYAKKNFNIRMDGEDILWIERN